MKKLLTLLTVMSCFLPAGVALGTFSENFDDGMAQGWGRWNGVGLVNSDADIQNSSWGAFASGDDGELVVDGRSYWVDSDNSDIYKVGEGTYTWDMSWGDGETWARSRVAVALLAEGTHNDVDRATTGLALTFGYLGGASSGVSVQQQNGAVPTLIANAPWGDTPLSAGANRLNYSVRVDISGGKISVQLKNVLGPWVVLPGLQGVDITPYINGSGMGYMGFKSWDGKKHLIDNVSYVPEPATLILLGMGVLTVVRRKRTEWVK